MGPQKREPKNDSDYQYGSENASALPSPPAPPPPPPPPAPAPLPRGGLNMQNPSSSSMPSESLTTHIEQAALKVKLAAGSLEMSVYSWEPCYFFFYGSLMDTDVIKGVTRLSEEPVLRSGYIDGFRMKMWGIYPTLIPKEGHRVQGQAWKVEAWNTFNRLQQYETNLYVPHNCTIHLDNGEILENSRVFCWAGDPQSRDLNDGAFDLEHYRKYFKPSIFGR